MRFTKARSSFNQIIRFYRFLQNLTRLVKAGLQKVLIFAPSLLFSYAEIQLYYLGTATLPRTCLDFTLPDVHYRRQPASGTFGVYRVGLLHDVTNDDSMECDGVSHPAEAIAKTSHSDIPPHLACHYHPDDSGHTF